MVTKTGNQQFYI